MSVLQPTDLCVTIKDERDIDLIPSGTKVTLISQNKSCWNFRGLINGIERSLLIFANNLKKVE